jgi:hypothetical protein
MKVAGYSLNWVLSLELWLLLFVGFVVLGCIKAYGERKRHV